MKKLALILAAIAVSASVVLTGCNNTEKKPTNGDTNVTDDTNANQNVPDELLTFEEAQEKLSELVAKKDTDNEIMLTVGGIPANASTVKYATVACNSYYAPDSANTDEELQKTIDSEVHDFFALNAAVVNLAQKNGIGITEEDFQTGVADNVSYLQGVYGEDFESIIEMYTLQTPYTYFENSLYNIYYSKLMDYYYGENGKAEDKNELTDKAIEEMKDSYVRAKHILISFPEDIEKDEEGNVVESAKADTLAKANDVLAKVDAGEDFDALIEQYGEDPGMESNPDGYYFTTGEMMPAFEESAFELGIGQTSGLVETPYGYHIIKKYAIEPNNAGFFASTPYQTLVNTTMTDMLHAEADTYETTYADGFEARQQGFLDDYYAGVAEAQAEQAAQAQSAE